MRFTATNANAGLVALAALFCWAGCSSNATKPETDGGVGGATGGTQGLDAGLGQGGIGNTGVPNPTEGGAGATSTGGGAGATSTGGGAGATSTGGGAGATGTGGAKVDSGAGGPAGGGSTGPGFDGSIPNGLLNPETTTIWRPGILADITNQPLGADGLPIRTTICQTVAPNQAANLQTILKGCASGTVVELASGTYTVPSTIYVPSGVVLRGKGSSGSSATLLVLADGKAGPVLAMGPVDLFDQTCYNNSNYTNKVVALAKDAAKGQNRVSVAANNTTFAAGDFALIDELNDSVIVSAGDSDGAFARKADRVLSQRVEITAVDAASGTLTLASPLHWTFKTSKQAQIVKVNEPVTTWAGIEHVWVQRGKGLGEYLGRKAGGIDISNAAHCWVKDVQTDGTSTGMHVTLTGTNHCVVRDSHFHNSAQYGFGQDNYGIVLRCGAADNLVENNIARYMNKPILFNNSGGGNVVGYNYADNQWSLDSSGGDQFQEASIDIHCTFPHMELVEGNYAAHVAASTTHGNGGYLTYFRNYISSQQAPDPIVWSLPSLPQTGNVAAFQFDETDHHMTVIGNILGSTTNAALGVPTSLGTATVSKLYMSYGEDDPAIFALGSKQGASATTLAWHGNFDTVNGTVMWNPNIASRTLPASLYYAAKPAWWPAGAAWPWTGPDMTPKVATLPAQATSAAFNYKTSDNPNCTANVGNYSCP